MMSKVKHLPKSTSVGSQHDIARSPKPHWSTQYQEILLSTTSDSQHSIVVLGGADSGQFCWVGDVLGDSISYHNDGRLQIGDLLLEVQGQCVAGYTLADVVEWMMFAGRNHSPVLFKTVAPELLTKDLKEFLNTRFQKGSADHGLQQIIRTNIYKRTVPCTTRPPRPGEKDGLDYRFLTIEEFAALEKTGELLESGIFDDNHYGTPKPPKLPVPSALPSATGGAMASSFHRSGSTSEIAMSASAQQPQSSDPKHQRNLSNIETSWSATGNKQPGDGGSEITNSDRNQLLQRNRSMEQLQNSGNMLPSGMTSMQTDHISGVDQAFQGGISSSQPSSEASDELPYGWERVDDPKYGVYYIDHVNRRTQYENPVAKGRKVPRNDHPGIPKSPRSEQRSIHSVRMDLQAADKSPPAYGNIRRNFFTRNPTELCGKFVVTRLTKSPRGLGFTIVGGNDPEADMEEFLQIKSITPNGPAAIDGQLCCSDVLVYIDDQCVLGFSHQDIIKVFQSIPVGETITIEVCRGYPLPFDPDDPNNEVITTVAVTAPGSIQPAQDSVDSVRGPANGDGGLQPPSPQLLAIDVVKGPMGFGFTIGNSAHGQRVKQILDHPRCAGLRIDDLILEIGGTMVRDLRHPEVVEVLKGCPVGSTTTFVVQRGGRKASSRSPVTIGNDVLRNSPDSSVEAAMRQQQLVADYRHSRSPSEPVTSAPAAHKEPIYAQTNRVNRLQQRPDIVEETRYPAEDFGPAESNFQGKDVGYHVHGEPPGWMDETGRMEGPRRPIQRGASLHNERVAFSYPFVADDVAAARSVDYYPPQDSSSALSRNLHNQLSFNENNSRAAPAVSARQRSKTPGPDFMRGVSAEFGGEEDGPGVPPKRFTRSKTPTMEGQQYSQPQRAARRAHPPMSGTPNFIPASHYLARSPHSAENSESGMEANWKPLPPYGIPVSSWGAAAFGGNVAATSVPKLSSSSMSSGLQGSPLADHRIPAVHSISAGNLPPGGSWTDSPASGASDYKNWNPATRTQVEEQFFEMPVFLRRLETGFGFRIIGGTEEGSQVSVGHVVPGGAADLDGHLRQGDEITYIDGLCVLGASHRKVVQLMSDAAKTGHVSLRIRRPAVRIPVGLNGIGFPTKFSYPYDVTLCRREFEGFGFILVSSVSRTGSLIGKIVDDSPADRSGALHVGDRVQAVNGVNVSNIHHEQIVAMIKDSGLTVVLTIGPPEDPSGGAMSSALGFSGISLPLSSTGTSSALPSQSESTTPRHSEYSPYHAGPVPLSRPLADSSKNVSEKSLNDSSYQRERDRMFLPQVQPQPPNTDVPVPTVAPSSEHRLITIELQRGARGFGFSIRGGREFNNMPLFVLKIAEGGAAHSDGRLRVGDQILEINGYGTQNMTHADAIDLIQSGSSTIRLLVKRSPTIRQPAPTAHAAAPPSWTRNVKSTVDVASRPTNGIDPPSSSLPADTAWSQLPSRGEIPRNVDNQPVPVPFTYAQLTGKYPTTAYR